MANKLTLFIASDHAGLNLKVHLIQKFSDFDWQDLGPATADRVDYPDFADKVAKKVQQGQGLGVLICGSGQGMAMRANKFSGVRAALCWNEEAAQLARSHNDANILCLGERLMSKDACESILKVFLGTEFEGGRHQGRVEKINNPLPPQGEKK